MKIVKKCNEQLNKIYLDRIINGDPPFILELPHSILNTYRQIKPSYTFNSDAAYEQGISFKSEQIFKLLKDNEELFYIFEKLPSMFIFDFESKNEINNRFVRESYILTDINILSKNVILVERSETIGNLFFVTDDKSLFLNLKLRLWL